MADDTLSLDFGSDKKFYVYLYRDPRPKKRNEPIYVGKGIAARGRAHFHWTRRADNPFLARILEKIRSASLAPIIEIVAWFDAEDDAFALERALIAKFGRRDTMSGSLTNLTDGGDGTSGFVPSAHFRALASARLKIIRAAQWDDPEFRLKAIRNLDAGRSDPEVRKRATDGIRKANVALAADPDRLAKQSEQRSKLRRAAWDNPEIRQRYISAGQANKEAKRISMKAHYATAPDAIAAKRAWMNKAMENADFRAKVTAGKARSKSDPEKQAMWAAIRAAMQTAAAAANKLAWADPVKRAARLAAMKAARERNRTAK